MVLPQAPQDRVEELRHNTRAKQTISLKSDATPLSSNPQGVLPWVETRVRPLAAPAPNTSSVSYPKHHSPPSDEYQDAIYSPFATRRIIDAAVEQIRDIDFSVYSASK